MATDAQNTANQANAQHSTGPRTEAGKVTSSRNALKHGLTAKTALMPDEDAEVHACFLAGMLDSYDPFNAAETALVEEMIDVQWRLRRASRFEVRILSAETLDMKALNNMSLHAARLKRQYSATFKEFQELHRANRKLRDEQMKDAEVIQQADWALERPSTLADNGFDFTVEEVTKSVMLKHAVEQAKKTIVRYVQANQWAKPTPPEQVV